MKNNAFRLIAIHLKPHPVLPNIPLRCFGERMRVRKKAGLNLSPTDVLLSRSINKQ